MASQPVPSQENLIHLLTVFRQRLSRLASRRLLRQATVEENDGFSRGTGRFYYSYIGDIKRQNIRLIAMIGPIHVIRKAKRPEVR
jgi:hypothetical protein